MNKEVCKSFILVYNNMEIAKISSLNEGIITLPRKINLSLIDVCNNSKNLQGLYTAMLPDIDRVINFLIGNTYKGKFDGLSDKDIKVLCKEVLRYDQYYKHDPAGIYSENVDKKWAGMYQKLKLVYLGSLGNGDYFLYSVVNGKIYEANHESSDYITESKYSLRNWINKFC